MTSIDRDALLERYRDERRRRLRADGNEQYVEIAGRYSHYADDPYAPPGTDDRPARRAEVDVAVIGAGFGGLLASAHLRELGVDDLCLIDKAADVGGTWYWNRYPGIACDTESYIYIPLLEELGYVPSEKYARGEEILEHCRRIAAHYDLYRAALLRTEVRDVVWDDARDRWIVRTDHGDELAARYVVLANGFLQKPKLPGIPGIERFGGHSFHTSRWDYAYTGGDAGGNLTGLADKRVGIIGTGATAVQCVPHLGASAAHLYVFQRTPSSVAERANRPTDPAWAAALEPGWQQRRIENFQVLTTGGWTDEDLVADGWTAITRKLLTAALANDNPDLGPEDLARIQQDADLERMDEIRARIDAVVRDPATAAALKPYYRSFCKRPCFHDEYLPTFNRPNVTLVDTHGRGVDEITEHGVVVDGVEYELDCIVFATGFEVGTDYSRRSGFPVTGRAGRTLSQAWAEGVRTFHGMHVHGFPNLLMMSMAQTGFTVNFPYVIHLQAAHAAWIAAQCLAAGVTSFEAAPDAEAAWVAGIVARGARAGAGADECTPGYYNNEGQADERTRQGGFFFGAPTEFAQLLADWRSDGTMEGLVRKHGSHRTEEG